MNIVHATWTPRARQQQQQQQSVKGPADASRSTPTLQTSGIAFTPHGRRTRQKDVSQASTKGLQTFLQMSGNMAARKRCVGLWKVSARAASSSIYVRIVPHDRVPEIKQVSTLPPSGFCPLLLSDSHPPPRKVTCRFVDAGKEENNGQEEGEPNAQHHGKLGRRSDVVSGSARPHDTRIASAAICGCPCVSMHGK